VSLPLGTTVASLQAQLANQRAALALAATGAAAAAGHTPPGTNMLGALAILVEAMRDGITDQPLNSTPMGPPSLTTGRCRLSVRRLAAWSES
jgi:hypothetical protein